MSRAALASRITALEQRAAQIEAAKVAFDLSSLSADQLADLKIAIYSYHGGVTEDEAWLLIFDDCYWRDGAKDIFDPRFRTAARRAIAAKAERHRQSLVEHEDAPADLVERLTRDTVFLRRVVERARALRTGWTLRADCYPDHQEMAAALRELAA